MKNRKVIKNIICILFLISIIAPILFISTHSKHNCTHNDSCKVCEEIVICKDILNVLGTCIIVASSIKFIFKIIKNILPKINRKYVRCTLVNLKVKLSN